MPRKQSRKKHNHSHASHHEAPKRGLKRWQKNVIHFGLISGIAVVFALEGAKTVDLAFLALAVVTEFS